MSVSFFQKITALTICAVFSATSILPSPAIAQMMSAQPMMIGPSAAFQPVTIRGVEVFPQDPLRFDFIVDHGNAPINQEQMADETHKLAEYFMASLITPEEDMWVTH